MPTDSQAIDPSQKRCDVCGNSLNEAESGFNVLEIPYHVIKDLRKVDESLADELLQNDGRLTYHSTCSHPVFEYLPRQSDRILISSEEENPTDNVAACPVCDIPVLKTIGRCGRCGKEI